MLLGMIMCILNLNMLVKMNMTRNKYKRSTGATVNPHYVGARRGYEIDHILDWANNYPRKTRTPKDLDLKPTSKDVNNLQPRRDEVEAEGLEELFDPLADLVLSIMDVESYASSSTSSNSVMTMPEFSLGSASTRKYPPAVAPGVYWDDREKQIMYAVESRFAQNEFLLKSLMPYVHLRIENQTAQNLLASKHLNEVNLIIKLLPAAFINDPYNKVFWNRIRADWIHNQHLKVRRALQLNRFAYHKEHLDDHFYHVVVFISKYQ